MIMLFEDSKISRISNLMLRPELSQWLNADSFAGGNGNISDCIKHLLSITDSVLCFHDVVPDNDVTIRMYNGLINEFSDNKNVIIVPIPCIEYYVLQMVYKLYSIEDSILTDALSFNNYHTTSESYETYCKYVLNHIKGYVCLRINRSGGEFYMSPCMCEYKKDKCYDIDMYNKAILLLQGLPCNSCKVSSMVHTDVKSVFDDIRSLYKVMWDKLSMHRPIHYSVDSLLWWDK